MSRSIILGGIFTAVFSSITIFVVLFIPQTAPTDVKAQEVPVSSDLLSAKKLTITGVEIRDGRRILTFDSGLSALLDHKVPYQDFLTEGRVINIEYVETDGPTIIKSFSWYISPPGCGC